MARKKEAALEREQHTHRLYDLARELAGIINQDQVSEALLRYLSGSERSVTVHFLDDNGKLQSISDNAPLNVLADMATLMLTW